MNRVDQSGGHDRYVELCALMTSGTLAPDERHELECHLAGCSVCREIYHQFQALTTEGIAALAPEFSHLDGFSNHSRASRQNWPSMMWTLAACLFLAVNLGMFTLGRLIRPITVPLLPAPLSNGMPTFIAEKQALDAQLSVSSAAMRSMREKAARDVTRVEQAEAKTQEIQNRLNDLANLQVMKDDQLQSLVNERDSLMQKLLIAQQEFRTAEEQLRTVRREDPVRLASLESEVKKLTARVEEQNATLRERDQYLTADRDVRDLMGARQLYIADVFDVDNNGSTRMPYGRIFYTAGRSLLFYAFDLDQQPRVKDAAIFQAWGTRNSAETAQPLNLGVLYLDNQENRRWMLRFDDAEKLAEINSVFVTIEPKGGSHKPTGKPFLYASLRRPPNHP
jgi:hypothetical protein